MSDTNAAASSFSATDFPPNKIIELLQSRQRPERDNGLTVLGKLLRVRSDEGHSQDPVLVEQCSQALLEVQQMLMQSLQENVAPDDNDLSMEGEGTTNGEKTGEIYGCLSASLAIILKTTETASEETRQFFSHLQQLSLRLICDQDVRVRLLAGDIIGALSKQRGPQVYESCKEIIHDIIGAELSCVLNAGDELNHVDGTGTVEASTKFPTMETDQDEYTTPTTNSYSPKASSPTSTNNYTFTGGDDLSTSSFERITVFEASPKGVRCSKLETTLKCLINIVNGLGSQFKCYVNEDFVNMVLNTLQHPNRFVREVGFSLCSALIEAGCIDHDVFGTTFADKLSYGLSDLCSQTRIAAAIATRKHILSVPISKREKYFDVLLPRLCLCRYYMADTKFLLYSQESWRLIVNTDGPQLVEKYINEVVAYYLEATGSENHAIREAACACIAELSRKINPTLVRPFVPKLLEALKKSFHDERWHVRDSACLGCGNFILNFPEECKFDRDNLLALFYENLGFPISVVRQGAAASIANAIRAYGTEIVPSVIERIIFGLEGVNRQLPDACCGLTSLTISPETRYSYPPGPWAQFIPYARPSQPWEFGDGCLYLIGDIAPLPECQIHLHLLIPKIIQASQTRSFSQHVVFLETMCKIVPPLAKGVGKKPFKEYLAMFFEPIFYSIESENPQTAAAGKLCLQQLALTYGPNILKSRIEQFDSRFVHYVEGF